MVLNTAAVGLWLVFGAGVWLWLRETAGGESILSVCFLIGLVSFVTLLLAGFTAFFVLVYRAPEVSDPRLLYDLSFGLLAMSGIPTALALGSYAALAFDTDRLPGWTASVAARRRAGSPCAPRLAPGHERLLLPRGRSDHRDSRHPVCLDRRHELRHGDGWRI